MRKTEKRTAANRKNALQSTGPKTPEGKAATSKNALRHGLRAVSPVVLPVEREEDWNAHREAVLRSLAAAPGLEEVLAERVAVHLWRLDRVVRFETEAALTLQEKVERTLDERDYYPHSSRNILPAAYESPAVKLQHDRDGLALLEKLEAGGFADKRPLSSGEVDGLLSLVYRFWTEEDEKIGEWLQAGGPFTIRNVFERLQPFLVENFHKDPFEDLAQIVEELREELQDGEKKLQEEARTWEDRERHRRRVSLLPMPEDLEKVTRYEAHLSRLFQRDLHELQRLQAGRGAGGFVPPPAVLDVNVSAAGEA